MIAYVQRPVVEFFEHLGWTPTGDAFAYHGVAHREMSIGLGGAG
jgi:predicted GNAT family N-acyltransferase